MTATKLVVGLGNPGPQYAGHRHNVGFIVADAIAKAIGAEPFREGYGGLVAEAMDGDVRVVVLKPIDLERGINGSGPKVREAMGDLDLTLADVFVVHDEMAIPPATLRAKVGGGDAGHNGLKSVTSEIGAEYARFRVGIGHPGSKEAVMGYVLGDFDPDEREAIDALAEGIAGGLPFAWKGQLDRFVGHATTEAAARTVPTP